MSTAPKSVRQPQDRKPKASAQPGGFEIEFEGQTYVIDQESLDDVELLDLLMSVEEDPRAALAAARRIVGDEQWEQMVESIRTERGRVPLTKLVAFAKLAVEPLGNFVGSLVS